MYIWLSAVSMSSLYIIHCKATHHYRTYIKHLLPTKKRSCYQRGTICLKFSFHSKYK